MRCPFLKDTEARFCEVSPFRKMIFRAPCPEDHEKCSSPDYVQCPSVAGRSGISLDAPRCPFLRECPVQFCEASSVTRFIPYSESQLSACQGEGHRYCDLYLSRVEPGRVGAGSRKENPPASGEGGKSSGEPDGVDGIEVPRHLSFAPNHLWMDLRDDGSFHVGADAFAARVLGRVEKASFVASLGVCRPVAVLRVRGLDLHLAFPNAVNVSGFNVSLRTEPYRIASDPYGRGWLFRGRASLDPAGESRGRLLAGLVRGNEAVQWMRAESLEMTRFVQEKCHPKGPGGEALLSDGGLFTGPVVQALDPADLLILFNEFFSLNREGRGL